EPAAADRLRALFKELFARGERYNETGGIHAAALTDGERLLCRAEDIGRHNAVDKVIGAAVIARELLRGRGLLVTGRISAELAYKAARAGLAWVATPRVPSTLALTIAARSGTRSTSWTCSAAANSPAPSWTKPSASGPGPVSSGCSKASWTTRRPSAPRRRAFRSSWTGASWWTTSSSRCDAPTRSLARARTRGGHVASQGRGEGRGPGGAARATG